MVAVPDGADGQHMDGNTSAVHLCASCHSPSLNHVDKVTAGKLGIIAYPAKAKMAAVKFPVTPGTSVCRFVCFVLFGGLKSRIYLKTWYTPKHTHANLPMDIKHKNNADAQIPTGLTCEGLCAPLPGDLFSERTGSCIYGAGSSFILCPAALRMQPSTPTPLSPLRNTLIQFVSLSRSYPEVETLDSGELTGEMRWERNHSRV